jgi:uncharacterized protein YkwD
MRNYLLIFSSLLLLSFQQSEYQVNRDEAQKAFALLQKIRSNPQEYAQVLQLPKDIKASNITLQWNDLLAQAAEKKALDMAKRGYFSHTDPEGYGMNYHIHKAGYTLNKDWIKNKRDNNFESIVMNCEGGEHGIELLIIDAGVPSKGHRKHLLGLDPWNASLTDIGIGYVETTNGGATSYMTVIIAKHDW